MNSPYSYDAGIGIVRQQIHHLSSKRLNGVPMYQGPQILAWMQVFPGTWILVDISEEAA